MAENQAKKLTENGMVSRNLSWQPKERKHPVLQDISLTFEPGHIYGIIGPNGSGKSTFLKHVIGFLPVMKGFVFWDGRRIEDYSRKELARSIAFVPQETRPDTDFTVYDIVMTGRNPYQKRFSGESAADHEKVKAALAFAGCEHLAEQSFASLSGGEAQRVIIARAIAQDTDWILLDEPVSNLDIRFQMELIEGLKALNREKGISIVIVLHDINLAGVCCDRIVMLKKGKVLHFGETKEALDCERLEDLYDIPFRKIKTEDGAFYYPSFGSSYK